VTPIIDLVEITVAQIENPTAVSTSEFSDRLFDSVLDKLSLIRIVVAEYLTGDQPQTRREVAGNDAPLNVAIERKACYKGPMPGFLIVRNPIRQNESLSVADSRPDKRVTTRDSRVQNRYRWCVFTRRGDRRKCIYVCAKNLERNAEPRRQVQSSHVSMTQDLLSFASIASDSHLDERDLFNLVKQFDALNSRPLSKR
jgi:hypothetical protein